MIDLTVKEEQLKRTIERAREKKIIIPTLSQQKNPDLIRGKMKYPAAELRGIQFSRKLSSPLMGED
jgi:hypothetical protein